MDATAWSEALPVLGLAVALAACAGLRAWLPLLLAAGLARFGLLELGPGFEFLASTEALAIFGLATLVEVVGDKVPAVDHTLDALATVLRPAAGALLATSVLGNVVDPLTAGVLGVAVGAPAALVPHTAKSALRLASSAFTAGLANPLLSFVEDVSTVVLFVIAVLAPLVVVALLLGAAWIVVRRVARRSRPVAA